MEYRVHMIEEKENKYDMTMDDGIYKNQQSKAKQNKSFLKKSTKCTPKKEEKKGE